MTNLELALVIDLRAAIATATAEIKRLDARWADDYEARRQLARWTGRKEGLEWALGKLVLVEHGEGKK